MHDDNVLWVETYRPKTVDDCILPKEQSKLFKDFVKQGHFPNLILAGPPGIGKTTIAKALINELGCDSIVINGSMNGNIDTLRTTIHQYASAMSIDGQRKYVIIDEADHLPQHSTQAAMRNFMEEFSKNCGFILTCNYKDRIIDPLQSRCTLIDFNKISNTEKPELAKGFMTRLCYILDKEKIQYDKRVLVELVKRNFLNWRKIINDVQRYSASGVIDTGILATLETNFDDLFDMIKNKEFEKMRRWVGENSDVDSTHLFRELYHKLSKKLDPASVPQLILTIAQYQFWASQVADAEINIVACLTEIMAEVTFNG
jgi:DNA polymerase III delta prime subunit